MRWFIFCGLIIGLISRFYFSPEVSAQGQATFVRVAVLKDVKIFELAVRGDYEIIDPQTSRVLQSGRGLRNEEISIKASHLVLGHQKLNLKRIRIKSEKDISVRKTQNRRYRGEIDVSIDPFGNLLVINLIELESYVKGVLFHEISHRWPLEAIKAQAVATRTYAVYQIQTNKDKLFDVTNDIYSQVYGGRNAERYRTNIAVNRTKGEILKYNDKVLPAYFHATCAGHTEDVSLLWNHKDLEPLKGVPCKFCSISPHMNWKKNFRSKDVQELLNQKGYKVGLIKEIKIKDRNESGRIRQLEIIPREGKSVIIEGRKFRDIVGPNVIKSNKYDIEMQGYYFDIIGEGWGHGVGMCQWGAYGMAVERFNYKEILDYYYPGADIEDL